MEVLKPLVVLALFGMILYGAYSVVQQGPGTEPAAAPAASGLTDAPPFTPPDVQVAASPRSPVPPPAAPPSVPTRLEPAPFSPPPTAATSPADQSITYLPAESAPPPSGDQVAQRSSVDPSLPVQPAATDPRAMPQLPAVPPPATLPSDRPATADRAADVSMPPVTPPGGPSSNAFASAWADAHEKLAAGRFAEALAALSVWYDDPSLGLEESQRLEDLLGQLAGTVIYSQQDLLLPPHVVAAGDTLAGIAEPLGVSPRLLAKINGVDDPQRLVPGEHLKLVRGPFDAVVSVSRRRISLQLNGAYAGSFPVVVGRRYLEKVGASLPVVDMQRGVTGAAPIQAGTASLRRAIVLGEGLAIEAVDDPVAVADAAPQTSLVMSERDLEEVLDILGPASRVLVRQ